MFEDKYENCPLCGEPYIPPMNEECKSCNSGPREFERLFLGWLYHSEWNAFKKNMDALGKISFGILPKLIALYGRYKKLEVRYNESPSYPINFVLWGPSSSGKTWLLYAFFKNMIDFRRISHSGKRFDFRLSEEISQISPEKWRDIDILLGPPPEKGTETLIQKKYKIHKTNNMDNLEKGVNTHVHILLTADGQGENQVPLLVNATDPNTPSSPLRKKPEMASLRIASKADVILLLVDLDMVDIPGAFDSFIASIKELLKILYENGRLEKMKRLAVCIPKIDKYEGLRYIGMANVAEKKKDFELIIEEKFGSSSHSLFTQIQYFIDDFKFEVDYFFLTSCGYYKGVANFDPATKGIANMQEWYPEGVHEPFFWALDSIERQRITNPDNHIPFQVLVKGEVSDLCKVRDSHYISYNQIFQLDQKGDRH